MDRSPKEKVVLIVDDDALVRESVRIIARTVKGVQTLTASTSDEALRIATEHHVDLVITDLNMPGETGVWLLEELRKAGNSVPVVIHSGSLVAGEDKKALHLGAARVLSKPADTKVLRKTIMELTAD